MLLCTMLSCIALSPASSRDWKATPEAIAMNYATIQDNRGKGELVVLIWFVPQMAAPGSNGAGIVSAMLDKYVVITVVHGRLVPATGGMSFDDIATLAANDQDDNPLTLVPKDSLPPVNIAMLASLEALFRQSLGPMGSGMKTFIFDTGALHSCKKGRLSVPFAGETYTWDTPIPGCPS